MTHSAWKEGLQENVCYTLEECFPLDFPGRKEVAVDPRDATLPSYMQRYPSSTPSTKPRVVFIKMLNPPSESSPRAAEEINSTPRYYRPSLIPFDSRVTPVRISISFESCAHDIDSPAG